MRYLHDGLFRIQQLASSHLFKHTSLYSLGNLSSQGLSLLVLPIFTRYLSPEEYGILDYTNSIKAILVVLATLSLNSFVLRHFFKLTNDGARNKLIGTTLLFVTLFSGFLLVLELIAAPIIIDRLGIQVPFSPYFAITFLNVFLESTFVIPLVFLRVRRKVSLFVVSTLGNAILGLGFGLILIIYFEWGVLGRYVGVLGSNVIFMLVYAIITLRRVSFSINTAFLIEGLRFSAPLLPAALASMVLASFDRIWLERYVSLSELGIYTLGCTLGTALLILVRAFYMAVEPDIFASFEAPDFRRRFLVLKERFVLAISLFGAMVIIFCKEAVGVLLHVDFLATYTIIPFFVVTSMFRASETLANTLFHAFNRTRYEFYVAVVGVALNVSANILLIPVLGVYGAAVASVVTYAATYGLALALVGRLGGFRWGVGSEVMTIGIVASMSLAIMSIDVGSSLFQTFVVKIVAVAVVGVLWTWIARARSLKTVG